MYEKLNVVWPADAVNVCLVLSVGNDAQVTPVPTDFRYWPLVPVVPSLTAILPLNLVVPSNVEMPVAFRFRVVISRPMIPPPPAPTRIPLT